MRNLLTEPLIDFNRSDGCRRKASLPQVYAALMSDCRAADPRVGGGTLHSRSRRVSVRGSTPGWWFMNPGANPNIQVLTDDGR